MLLNKQNLQLLEVDGQEKSQGPIETYLYLSNELYILFETTTSKTAAKIIEFSKS